ncbi:MAG: hypothetical protein AAFV69_09870 [Pseudomonadota bacterium]
MLNEGVLSRLEQLLKSVGTAKLQDGNPCRGMTCIKERSYAFMSDEVLVLLA